MKGFRNRILAPLAIPLGATVLAVAVVFNFSRILLALEERRSSAVATVVAIIVAAAVLFGSAYFSSRREARTAGLAVLASAAFLLVFAGGYGLGATGAKEGGAEGESAAGGEPGGEVNVVAKDPFMFDPKELTVPAGEVKVNLTNQGAIVHTFEFENVPGFVKLETSGTRRQAPSGKGPTDSGSVKLKPGSYIFFCSERGHRGSGMEGKLAVTPGGGGGGEVAASGEANVIAKDPFTFEPKELTVKAGTVKINLTNQGAIVHTFEFENVPGFVKLETSGTRRQAPSGKGTTDSGTAKLKQGTYVFFCSERGHRGSGMEGRLKVL